MLSIIISNRIITKWQALLVRLMTAKGVVILAGILSVAATAYSYQHGYITAYGDAESHLNIAKRVVDSITPGFAQLGGIWLPIPHLLMVPFVKIDFLWRSGLAGAIVSGTAFVFSALYLYKLVLLLTKSHGAAFLAATVFMVNPNILYLQATPMTELVLIGFFLLSSYYFIIFLENDKDFFSLILAAFFGFCAALSRYDGWFLVLVEAAVLLLLYLPWEKVPNNWLELKSGFVRKRWEILQGRLIIFSILAFFGIVLWFAWGYLILGDPLYFTHSQFSAKSQQNNWLARGELPAYRNLPLSVLYYLVTGMSNIGVLPFALAIAGTVYLLYNRQIRHRYYVSLILLVPFIFNVATLFLGQSVIFIPHLTPLDFEWRLFNVRYGVMMVPLAAVAVGFLFYRMRYLGKLLILGLLVVQVGLYVIGHSKVISLEDGVSGLSSAKVPDAQYWLANQYDEGFVLVDDFARTLSIIRTDIPMEKVIYVGNRPYWEDSLSRPEQYVRWVVMQKDDSVWKNFIDDKQKEGQLFKYYQKAYTSPEILIFKRNDAPVAPEEISPNALQVTIK